MHETSEISGPQFVDRITAPDATVVLPTCRRGDGAGSARGEPAEARRQKIASAGRLQSLSSQLSHCLCEEATDGSPVSCRAGVMFSGAAGVAGGVC